MEVDAGPGRQLEREQVVGIKAPQEESLVGVEAEGVVEVEVHAKAAPDQCHPQHVWWEQGVAVLTWSLQHHYRLPTRRTVQCRQIQQNCWLRKREY